jgi:hypothetical protein
MAERTVALKLQLDGVPQTISSVEELEAVLVSAKGKLDALDGDKFTDTAGKVKQVTDEVKKTETGVANLGKKIQGISFEKKMESFAKIVGGVSAGFAGATAAAQLFGFNSENVTKAAATAQNLLTVAMAARGFMEATVASETVVQTVATAGSTVATAGSTVATFSLTAALRTLYATMLANPFTAILVVVGLLVTAFLALSDSTEKEKQAQEELDLQLKKSIITLNQELKILKDINDVKIAQAEAEVTTEAAKQKKLHDLRIQGYKDAKKIADEQYWLLVTASFREIEALNKKYDLDERDSKEYKDKLLEINNKYNSDLLAQENASSDATKAIKIENIAFDKTIADQKLEVTRMNNANQIAAMKDGLSKELKTLKSAYDEQIKEANIKGAKTVDITRKYENDRVQIIKQARLEITNLSKELNKELLDSEGRSYKQRIDDVIKLETDKRTELEKGLKGLKDAGKATQKEIDEANQGIIDSEKLQQIKILAIQKEISTNYLQGQVNLFAESQKLQTEFFGTEEELEENKNILFKSSFDNYKKIELDKIKLALESAGVEKTQIDETLKKYEDYFNKLGLLQLNNTKIQEANVQVNKIIADQTLELQTAYYKDIKDAQDRNRLDSRELKSELTNIEKVYQVGLLEIQKNALQAKLDILKLDPTINPEELKRIKAELLKVETEYNNKVGVMQLEYNVHKAKIERDAVKERKKIILEDPTSSPEAKEEINKELLKADIKLSNAQSALRKKRSKELTDDQKTFLADIGLAAETIASSISKISSMVAQSFSTDLTILEKEFNRSMTDIEEASLKRSTEGETEYQARMKVIGEKKLENEKSYQAKKAQIEKEARIKSLQFQIAQSIADATAATIKTFAQYGFTPVGFVLAGLGAALMVAQVAIIKGQLNAEQSMARGGLVKGRSHEQGGVRYANGGVTMEGNEAVINRRSTLQYGSLLSQINEQGGGKPIYINSAMDSRLIEVLASQKQAPIRAYVLETDITKSQAINRRLEALASF